MDVDVGTILFLCLMEEQVVEEAKQPRETKREREIERERERAYVCVLLCVSAITWDGTRAQKGQHAWM